MQLPPSETKGGLLHHPLYLGPAEAVVSSRPPDSPGEDCIECPKITSLGEAYGKVYSRHTRGLGIKADGRRRAPQLAGKAPPGELCRRSRRVFLPAFLRHAGGNKGEAPVWPWNMV